MEMGELNEAHANRLTHALAVLAGDPCIQIGRELHFACRDVCYLDAGSTESSQVCDDSLSTWLCDEAHFFTLIKTESGTLVYSHTNGVLYYATPQAQLAPACPVDTAILCQFTFDSLPSPEGPTPRLLAFDVLQPSDPAARGGALRTLEVHLPAPLFCVQWVGPRRYLTSHFVAGLPHRTRGCFALTQDPRFLVSLSSI
jgi:hypothetical protein